MQEAFLDRITAWMKAADLGAEEDLDRRTTPEIETSLKVTWLMAESMLQQGGPLDLFESFVDRHLNAASRHCSTMLDDIFSLPRPTPHEDAQRTNANQRRTQAERSTPPAKRARPPNRSACT